jgi:glycosyltransferase involved in cell wall biosynthesis
MIRPAVARDSLSVVVPVFNSASTLPELVERLEAALDTGHATYEIVLVNDGSVDASWSEIKRLSTTRPSVRGLDLARNFGQHNALLAGIRAARNDVIVTLDDDLQHPPEEISKLLARLDEGYDVVYGTPAVDHHRPARALASRLTKIALRQFMAAETARSVSAFRAIRAPVRDAFADYQSATVSLDVLLTWGTASFSEVQVRHDPRRVGRSNYSAWQLMTHAIDMIAGFSTGPLRVASVLGFAFTVFGIGVLAYVLANYMIRGGRVPGFTFLAALTAVFAGMTMFVLGIIGEYLARVHLRVMERPPYVVRTEVSRDGD